MSDIVIIAILTVIIFAVLMTAIVLAERRKRNAPTQNRGSDPGRGSRLMQSTYESDRHTQSTSYHVPKDPQAYAKAFAPKKTD